MEVVRGAKPCRRTMESRPEDEKNETLKFQAEVNEMQWSLIQMLLKNLIDNLRSFGLRSPNRC